MNWKGIVKTVAPALGTALGSPMAGAAVREIADKWLGDGNASEQDLERAISAASPEELAKLRAIDADFKSRMRELDIDLEKLEVQDRQGARDLFRVNIWPQIALSTVFGIGYFVVLALFLGSDVSIPDSLRDPFNIVLGVLTAAISQIMNFWFGSSKGSQEKDAKLGPAPGK